MLHLLTVFYKMSLQWQLLTISLLTISSTCCLRAWSWHWIIRKRSPPLISEQAWWFVCLFLAVRGFFCLFFHGGVEILEGSRFTIQKSFIQVVEDSCKSAVSLHSFSVGCWHCLHWLWNLRPAAEYPHKEGIKRKGSGFVVRGVPLDPQDLVGIDWAGQAESETHSADKRGCISILVSSAGPALGSCWAPTTCCGILTLRAVHCYKQANLLLW